MTPPRPGSAVTAMWAWDNPVSPADDPRGRGYAPAAPDRLAAFARAGGLREVHVLAPSGPAGPVDEWFAEAVAALHAAGVSVTAVAGVRDATAAWVARTTALGDVDRLQVAVLPWTPRVGGTTEAAVGRAVGDVLAAVRSAAAALPVDACVPWWIAADGSGDGGGLGPVVAAADRVVVAAPAAHAAGSAGVLERAAPAVAALVAAGRPFLVGVETDSPDAAGGADRTFWDEGPVAMVRECGLVAAALAGTPGFEGVAVASHRAWRRLLGV